MKTKLHTAFLYPLILIFSSFLKGKKTEFKNFFINEKKHSTKENILEVISEENEFYSQIKYFFDKSCPLYDKANILFKIDISKAPEDKKYFAFDFQRVLNIFYTMSMLSSRIPNNNIDVDFICEKQKLSETQINHLLRYSLLTFASKKVDTLYFDTKLLKDDKSLLAYETMLSYLQDTTLVNFSNAKNLYVITCKQDKKSFDIIWSSNDDIELTEFGKVYDKYGKLATKNIKISTSPIYAFHK
ncbi:hypothetical protein ALC152_16950 [Arcobacter sp. 15-2]|uniref:hypothetical protein n=1 Tax=Arcobacter sp. 15-2 TaxID=3374109 RepID=UPI00399CB907